MASFPAASGSSITSQSEDAAVNEVQASTWMQQVEQRLYALTAAREEQIQALQSELRFAQAEIRRLNNTTPSSSPSVPITRPEPHVSRSPKYPDPEPFNGSRDQFTRFRSNLRMKLMSNYDWYPTEQDKLRYVLGRLSGDARKRFESKIKADGSVDYTNTEELFMAFELAFGDPFKDQHAMRKLQRCFQGNRPFSTWFSEFQLLAIDSKQDEKQVRVLLETNASREYIDRLYLRCHDVPKLNFEELVKEFQAVENHFRLVEAHGSRMAQGNSGSNISRPQNSRTTTAPAAATTVQVSTRTPSTTLSTATGTHPGPMDTSVTRGPLSPEEKAHRRTQGLCLYCGQPGHIAINCPSGNKKNLRIAETNVVTTTPSTSSSSSPSESGNGVSLN